MSGSNQRRRRRSGSTSRRYKPSELVPIQPRSRRKIDTPELLASGAVGLVAIMLIVLIWIVTGRAINEQRTDIRERVEYALAGQAATLAEEVRLELQIIDQSLTVLQNAWKLGPDKFKLTEWEKQLPALTAVANDIFIADEKRIIRQGTIPASIGQGIGAAYVNFPHGSLEKFAADGSKDGDSRSVVAQAGSAIDARLFLMYVVRPLGEPKGWLIGASYRSAELTRVYAKTVHGFNGVTALIDTKRGGLQAIAGPSARRPKVDVQKSVMFEAMQKAEFGIWTGETAMDGVGRIHAYHKVPGRDMMVVIGTVTAQAMAPAENLANGANALAMVGSVLVLSIGGVVLFELFTLRSNRRRQRTFERNEANLEAARADLGTMRAHAILAAAQLRAVLEGASDGIAMIDAAMRLSGWTPRFALACGLPPEALREGLPIDELLRQQARAGVFGPVADIETEVLRRQTALQSGGQAEALTQIGPQGQPIRVHARPVAEGGLVMILGDLDNWRPVVMQAARPVEPIQAADGAETDQW